MPFLSSEKTLDTDFILKICVLTEQVLHLMKMDLYLQNLQA